MKTNKQLIDVTHNYFHDNKNLNTVIETIVLDCINEFTTLNTIYYAIDQVLVKSYGWKAVRKDIDSTMLISLDDYARRLNQDTQYYPDVIVYTLDLRHLRRILRVIHNLQNTRYLVETDLQFAKLINDKSHQYRRKLNLNISINLLDN